MHTLTTTYNKVQGDWSSNKWYPWRSTVT